MMSKQPERGTLSSILQNSKTHGLGAYTPPFYKIY